MLTSMRNSAQSWLGKIILFGLLGMAMAGLMVMDVQGVFSNGFGTAPVAKIGREKIMPQDLDRMVSSTLRERNIPRNIAIMVGVPQQVLMQEINSRLFAKAARDAGIIPDDVAAAKRIEELLAPYVKDGMSHEQALKSFLSAAGLAEPNLVNMMKGQIAVDTLLSALTSGIHAPQRLVEDAARYHREQRKAAYFTVTAADEGALPTPTEDALKEHYEANAAHFAHPEYRTLKVLVLDRQSLGLGAQNDETLLRKYYDTRIAEFTVGETRTVEQVVVQDEKMAQDIQAAAANGTALEKAAKDIGKGSATYIAPQLFTEKEMAIELSPVAFASQEGDTTAPVQSPLGWHILHIKKIAAATTRPFSEVKNQIAHDLAADTSATALYEQANKVDDLLAGGGTLDEAAELLAITPLVIEKIDAQGNTIDGKSQPAKDVPSIAKLLEKGFSLPQGEASQLIEDTKSGAFVMVSPTEVIPSEIRPLEEVKTEVAASWREKARNETLARITADITKRLKDGEDFAKIAASFNKTLVTTSMLHRNAEDEKDNRPAGFTNALFSLPKTGKATTLPTEKSTTVIRFADRQTDNLKDMGKEERGQLASALQRSMGETITSQYRKVLMTEYDVSIDDEVLQKMYAAQPAEDEPAF